MVKDSHSTEEETEDQRGSYLPTENHTLGVAGPNSIIESSLLHSQCFPEAPCQCLPV